MRNGTTINMNRLKFPSVGLIVLGILLGSAQPAFALSAEQKKVLDSGAKYFNVEETIFPCNTGGLNLVGSENAEKIWNFFIGRGLTPPQVAGIMGNLQAESGLNPRRIQSTPTPSGDRDAPIRGKGFGLAQWTFADRQIPLEQLAQSKGVVPGDLGVQLEYLMIEFEGKYKAVYDEIRASNDVNRVSDIFMTKFERPADQSEAKKEGRRVLGRNFLAKYGSTSPSGAPASAVSCGVDGSGQVVGNYSLPLDRKWYDQDKNSFTKPHPARANNYAAADIPVPLGTPVYSMSAGKIIKAPVGGGCGVGVIVDAGYGVQFTYCHGSDGGSVPGAKQGDSVNAGQLIMHSASTGASSGPHLHVQIKVNGQNRCPQPLFVGIAEGSPSDPRTLPATGCY